MAGPPRWPRSRGHPPRVHPCPVSPPHAAFLPAGLLCSPRPGPSRSPGPAEPLRPGPQRHAPGVGRKLQLGARGLAPRSLPPGLAGRRREGLHGPLPGPRAGLRAFLLPHPQQPGRLPEVSAPRPAPRPAPLPRRASSPAAPPSLPVPRAPPLPAIPVSQEGAEGTFRSQIHVRLPHSWQSLNPKPPLPGSPLPSHRPPPSFPQPLPTCPPAAPPSGPPSALTAGVRGAAGQAPPAASWKLSLLGLGWAGPGRGSGQHLAAAACALPAECLPPVVPTQAAGAL